MNLFGIRIFISIDFRVISLVSASSPSPLAQPWLFVLQPSSVLPLLVDVSPPPLAFSAPPVPGPLPPSGVFPQPLEVLVLLFLAYSRQNLQLINTHATTVKKSNKQINHTSQTNTGILEMPYIRKNGSRFSGY